MCTVYVPLSQHASLPQVYDNDDDAPAQLRVAALPQVRPHLGRAERRRRPAAQGGQGGRDAGGPAAAAAAGDLPLRRAHQLVPVPILVLHPV